MISRAPFLELSPSPTETPRTMIIIGCNILATAASACVLEALSANISTLTAVWEMRETVTKFRGKLIKET